MISFGQKSKDLKKTYFTLIIVLWNVTTLDFVAAQFSNRRFQVSSRNRPTSRVEVRYSELQKLNVACYPRDTCRVNSGRNESIIHNFCHCGSVCTMFDTCCLDSRYRAMVPDPDTRHHCTELHGPKHYEFKPRAFLIDRCKSNWNGLADVKEMCLDDGDAKSDPMLFIPMTNPKKRMSYKNLFCAVCNYEDPKDLISWELFIFIRDKEWNFRNATLTDLKNLKYNGKDWKTDGSGWVFFKTKIPARIRSFVYTCPYQDIVSKCPTGWNDNNVKKKCASYMAMVAPEGVDKRYRNVHCAICNGEDVNKLKCLASEERPPYSKTPFNLGLLLDVNPSNGPIVGRTRKCKLNHVYHPTKQICIRLAGCLRGLVVRNGECVRPGRR